MPYSAEISRTNPSCFLFLIDQSGSMADGFGAGETAQRKCDALQKAVNRILKELTLKCAKSEGIRDYYHIGVLGYGAQVGPAFSGALAGKEMIPVSEIANNPSRLEEVNKKVDDGAGGLVDQQVKMPIWFEAEAKDGTPMCEAFSQAHRLMERWVADHPASYPPIVINVTDGESSDGDPVAAAQKLQSLSTGDGSLLLFNLHLSSTRAAPVEFPDSDLTLADQFARRLYGMSSPLPDRMREIAQREGFNVGAQARGFVFNADLVSMVRFLDIGTRVGNLR